LRLKQAFDQLAELQAERIQRLALAQEALMPRPEDFPDAHFQMSLRQVLQAGGDFYDVIAVGPHIIDYIVADASGHDLAASFWTASLKTLLSEYATPINTPRQILRLVNNALMRILPSGVFFTAIYARLNRKRGRVWLVNAGHPPACIMPANGQAGRFISQEGDIIGVFPDADFNETEVAVQPHDRIFLYSDGLIEINGLQSAELSPLLRVCHAHGPAPLEQAVPSIVREITAGLVVHDDIVLMGVEV
jgi:sigma-B regulation protein RsbU (phosphoserine phosphatase)